MRPLPENSIKKYEIGYPCMLGNVVGRIVAESPNSGSWGYINGIRAYSIVHFGTPHGSLIETGVAYLAELTEEGKIRLDEYEKDALKTQKEKGTKPYNGQWKIVEPIPDPIQILTQKSYLVGVHRYAFRAGEPAEIIGLKWCRLSPIERHDWRLAYEIEFFDGKKDFVSINDVIAGNHVIISDIDLIEERIPPVTK
jgi:hypothetical protein